MSDRLSIVRIAGDGVGQELVAAGSRLIETLCGPVNWIDMPAGLRCMEQYGTTAPQATLDALRFHGIGIKGPFATPNGGTIRSANYYIRRDLDLFACLRPLPIDRDRPILLVRENVEDLYGAIEWMPTPDLAHAAKIASRGGCERIADYAFTLARSEGRGKVTVVHKANNLKLTEGMFLDTAYSVARRFPDITVDELLADTACATLVTDPGFFDVILTSNTLGDVLSSLGAALAGSLGLVGSLNSGAGIRVAEAGHGDAAALAGRNRVNPVAFLDSVRLLLAAIGLEDAAAAAAQALAELRENGPRTFDLGGEAGTGSVVDFVCRRAGEAMKAADVG